MTRTLIFAALAALYVPAATFPVDTTAELASLNHTNGNKLAASRGKIYSVYAKAGQIYLSYSSNTQTWSTPLAIASGAEPAVAAGDQGLLGVVFSDAQGSTYYTWCQPNGLTPCTLWNGPYKLHSGNQPSIARLDGKMYVAAAAGGIVIYSSFNATLAADLDWATANIEWVHYNSGVCTNDTVAYPVVTVRPGPAVRVSYLFKQQASNNPGCGVVPQHVAIASKIRTGPHKWQINLYDTQTDISNLGKLHSLSAADHSASNNFYIAASFYSAASADQTLLMRRTPAGLWQKHVLNSQKSNVDVETGGQHCAPVLRLGVSLANSTYGLTAYQTGSWTNSTSSPTWTSTVAVSTVARDPQVSFLTAGGSFSAKELSALYVRQGSSLDTLQVDSNAPPPQLFCQPAPPCCFVQ